MEVGVMAVVMDVGINIKHIKQRIARRWFALYNLRGINDPEQHNRMTFILYVYICLADFYSLSPAAEVDWQRTYVLQRWNPISSSAYWLIIHWVKCQV